MLRRASAEWAPWQIASAQAASAAGKSIGYTADGDTQSFEGCTGGLLPLGRLDVLSLGVCRGATCAP
jgi:hypothetical protein